MTAPVESQLVLLISRRPGQMFRIGEEIEVKVLEVDGTTVRIGITAPATFRVCRGELLDRRRKGRLRHTARANGEESKDDA